MSEGLTGGCRSRVYTKKTASVHEPKDQRLLGDSVRATGNGRQRRSNRERAAAPQQQGTGGSAAATGNGRQRRSNRKGAPSARTNDEEGGIPYHAYPRRGRMARGEAALAHSSGSSLAAGWLLEGWGGRLPCQLFVDRKGATYQEVNTKKTASVHRPSRNA
jgi:hypothetical protein